MITTALTLRPPLRIHLAFTSTQRVLPHKTPRLSFVEFRRLPVCTFRSSFENRKKDVHQAKKEPLWIIVGRVQALLLRLLPAIVGAIFLSLASRFLPWGCSNTPSSVHGCYLAPRLPRALAVDVSSPDRPQIGHGRIVPFPKFHGGRSIPFASAGLSREEAKEQRKLHEWIEGVRVDAFERGVSPATVDRALAGIQPLKRVMQRETSQPEKALPLQAYVDRTVTEFTIKRGLEAYHTHEELLTKVEERFGVPPSVLVALWGVESSFGRNCGDFDSVQALLTLAYQCNQPKRARYFRGELLAALDLLEAGVVPAGGQQRLQGSWAGAMGQCQFMPSSYAAYAVRMEGEGMGDIWTCPADVFASMANYLNRHGWQKEQRALAQVNLTKNPKAQGLDTVLAVEEWVQQYGVMAPDLPSNLKTSLVAPDGVRGKAYLVGPNFRALLKYNNSISYAVTVATLAGEIEGRVAGGAVDVPSL